MTDFLEIGVSNYYYDLISSGGRLRNTPEDFFVEEIFEKLPKRDEGKVLILKLMVRNWEHNRLIRYLARSLGVSPDRIYFAGTKDKRSLKIQYLSIPGCKFKEFKLEDVTVLEYFYLDKPLTLGTHFGNFFRIKVEDVKTQVFVENCRRVSVDKIVPNFYGPQRFGNLRPVTHLVGREIVKGNYEEATRIFIGFPGHDRFSKERIEYFENPDPPSFVDNFPKELDLEYKVLEHLVENPGDHVGAIKRLPENLVQMFIHAYQGFLFNKILSKRIGLEKGIFVGDIFKMDGEFVKVTEINKDKLTNAFNENKGTPTGQVIGYGSDFAGGIMGDIEREVIEGEGIKNSDFKLPFGLKSHGERRGLYFFVQDLNCENERVSFTLKAGCYATSLLREIMREEKVENY